MAEQNIKITISENGSRVVIRNIREIADAAKEAHDSADKMNSGLKKTNNHSFSRLRSEFSKLDNTITRSIYKVRQMMTLMAAFAGTTISTGAIVKAMDSYTNLENRLKLVSDSQAQLNQLQDEMFQIAKRSRASVEDTTIAFSRFDLALKSVGRSQKDSLMVTETVNKMIAMSGKGAQESAAALLQLSQAFSKGKLDGDEFRTVAETMPLLMDAMAKKLGVTRGELLELRKQGKLTLDVMIEAIRDAQPQVDAQFSGFRLKVSDALTELKNQWIRFWGELDHQVGVSSALASALAWLSRNLKLVAAAGVTAFSALALYIAGPVVKAIAALGAAALANPWLAATMAIAGLITYLVLMQDELRESDNAFAKLAVGAIDSIATIATTFDDMLSVIGYGYTQLFSTIGSLWNQMYNNANTANQNMAASAEASAKAQHKSYADTIGLTRKDFWGLLEFVGMAWDMLASLMATSMTYAYENMKRGIENVINWIDRKLQQAANLFRRFYNAVNVTGILGENKQIQPIIAPEYQKRYSWDEATRDNTLHGARDFFRGAADRYQRDTGTNTLRLPEELKTRNKLIDALRGEDAAIQKRLKDLDAQSKAEKAGVVIDKEYYRRGLTIKRGAEAGGKAETGTYAAAYAFKKIFGNNVVRFGAFNDLYHKGKTSTHNSGLAFDATPKQSLSQGAKAGLAAEFNQWLKANGFDARAKFERARQVNANGTKSSADHIHFNFKSVAEAKRFEQFMQAQLSGGGSGKRGDFVSVAEEQAKAAIEATAAYDELINKTQQEIDSLRQTEPLRLAIQKSVELTTKLKEKELDLDNEQLASIQKLSEEYENAKRAAALSELAEGRSKELANVQALTTEEKALLQAEEQIKQFRKDGIPLSTQQADIVKQESVAHAKSLELLAAKNELWLNQDKIMDDLIVKQIALNELIASGRMSGQIGGVAQIRNNGAIGEQNQNMGMNAYGNELGLDSWEDLKGSMLTGATELLEGYTGTLNDLSNLFGDFFTDISSGFADSIGSAIVDSENLGEALRNVGQDALRSFISGLVKLGVQWAITQMLIKTTSKSTSAEATTQGVLQAAALTKAYAPAATMANVASYGGATAAGLPATMAAVTLASAIPSMFNFGKGFREGGYTGNRGVNDIAGVVHGQEFVMDAKTTRRIGVGNLEALRNGNLSLSNGASASGGRSSGITVKIENYASGVSHQVEQISEDEIRIIAREEAKNVVRQDSDQVVATNVRNSTSRTAMAINNQFNVTQRR